MAGCEGVRIQPASSSSQAAVRRLRKGFPLHCPASRRTPGPNRLALAAAAAGRWGQFGLRISNSTDSMPVADAGFQLLQARHQILRTVPSSLTVISSRNSASGSCSVSPCGVSGWPGAGVGVRRGPAGSGSFWANGVRVRRRSGCEGQSSSDLVQLRQGGACVASGDRVGSLSHRAEAFQLITRISTSVKSRNGHVLEAGVEGKAPSERHRRGLCRSSPLRQGGFAQVGTAEIGILQLVRRDWRPADRAGEIRLPRLLRLKVAPRSLCPNNRSDQHLFGDVHGGGDGLPQTRSASSSAVARTARSRRRMESSSVTKPWPGATGNALESLW